MISIAKGFQISYRTVETDQMALWLRLLVAGHMVENKSHSFVLNKLTNRVPEENSARNIADLSHSLQSVYRVCTLRPDIELVSVVCFHVGLSGFL